MPRSPPRQRPQGVRAANASAPAPVLDTGFLQAFSSPAAAFLARTVESGFWRMPIASVQCLSCCMMISLRASWKFTTSLATTMMAAGDGPRHNNGNGALDDEGVPEGIPGLVPTHSVC